MCPGGSQTLGTNSAFDGNQSHWQHRPRCRRTMNSDIALGFSLILEGTSCSSGPPSLYGLSIKLILKEQKWPQMSPEPYTDLGENRSHDCQSRACPQQEHGRSFRPGQQFGSPFFLSSLSLFATASPSSILRKTTSGKFFFHDAFS